MQLARVILSLLGCLKIVWKISLLIDLFLVNGIGNSLVFTSDVSTSANTVILILPWKGSWHRHKHKHEHKENSFSWFLVLALLIVFAQQHVKTKHRSGVTQAKGYLPHVVMFGQWKQWIRITSPLTVWLVRMILFVPVLGSLAAPIQALNFIGGDWVAALLFLG